MSVKNPMDQTIIARVGDLSHDVSPLEPYLIVIAGANIGKLYDLKGESFVGGRLPDNNIWIEDNTISRKHFCIKRQDGHFVIEDLNSTNGTFVNNRRIQTAVLKSGDKVQISKDTILQFDFYDEKRRVNEQKRYEMGVKDAATGTFNKTYFLQRVMEEFSFSKRQGLPLSLILFDVDHFKVINDTYGHLAGDQVLREMSLKVNSLIRKDDVFCRFGGEEFVILMRNTACQPAVNLAERLRLAIASQPVVFDEQTIKVMISLGVSTFLDDNFKDYVALIAEADKFLYQSKGMGRNRVSAVCLPTT